MTSQNHLELKGDFRRHPLAELIVEILQARFSGSLRVSRAKQKSIIYFREGEVVYAVSNSRELRLFNILLTKRKIDEKTLVQFDDLANDIELAGKLESKGVFSPEELAEIITVQIQSIIVDALTWPDGEWHFSPLARLREDLVYGIDIYKLLVDYARCTPGDVIVHRFRSVQEVFCRGAVSRPSIMLQAHETYVLDLFNESQLTIQELRPICSLPENGALQALYVLWLGGFLVRRDWSSAFSATKLGEIRTARLDLVKSAAQIVRDEPKAEPAESTAEEAARLPEIQISLEDYLDRVENAETLYDVLGVSEKASGGEIKNAYFAMAKLFHPDRFHREESPKLRRIQVAFTQIAHAYETLKNSESRENYDFKMRKELELREKRRAAGAPKDAGTAEERQAEQGLDSFEKGLEALSEDEFAAAAGHLSRAVHYSPQNALYHAYFGKALSQLEKQHHKAEASLQQAVKLDPKNPKIRMMLVEFFIEMKMARRAEGELKRFLEIAPGNREAMKLLDQVQAKAQA